MKLNIHVGIRLDEETDKKLNELSEKREEEKSRIIRKAIKSYLDKNKTIPYVNS